MSARYRKCFCHCQLCDSIYPRMFLLTNNLNIDFWLSVQFVQLSFSSWLCVFSSLRYLLLSCFSIYHCQSSASNVYHFDALLCIQYALRIVFYVFQS